MQHPQNIDLTLNDATRSLVVGNRQSMNNLERIYAILTNRDIRSAHAHISSLNDTLLSEYKAANPTIKTDSTVAYVQTLITAIANLTEYGFNKTATVVNGGSTIAIRAFMPSISYIKIVGGNIAANGTLDSVLDDAALFEKIRAFVVDIFMDARSDFFEDQPSISQSPMADILMEASSVLLNNNPPLSQLPINHLTHILNDNEAVYAPTKPIARNKPINNKILCLSDLKEYQDINNKMFTSIFFATVLGHLIQLKMPHITPAIRATTDYASLIINTQSSQIHLSTLDNEATRYFNVYWQGFVDGRIDSYGTTAVCCDRMFNISDLQMMISVLYRLDNALIISWQPIDNLQDFKDLNT